jgi:hypothetical protein
LYEINLAIYIFGNLCEVEVQLEIIWSLEKIHKPRDGAGMVNWGMAGSQA